MAVVLSQDQLANRPGTGIVASVSGGSTGGGTKASYYYNPDNTGGVDYFYNGVPITNAQYAKATGEDTTAIQNAAAATFARNQATPTAPSVTSGGGGAAGPVGPSAADTDPLLASLASLDTILANKNTQSQQEHDAAMTGYDAADALDHQAIDQNTHQNEQNLTGDDWDALLNAANGASGLRGTLASIGALGGSGFDVIRHLTGLAANSDIGAAKKTFESNAQGITQAAADTTQKEAQRRKEADATLANDEQNNQASVLTSKQNIFQSLANLFGTGTSQGNSYAAQAGALAAPIAATTRATVAPYATASSLYSPDALKTYLAGTQNLNASTTPSQSAPINSPSYIPPTKKDATLTGVA